ncbi:MAG: hypothetical protein ACK5DD_08880 [Cyclobacteriaceae bacterium]
MKKALFGAFWLGIFGCTTDRPATELPNPGYHQVQFKSYWYGGKAEITTYHLNQSRYGENREGNATLIFVTEDFSRNKLVKLDNPGQAGDDKVSVLKMNFTKNFVTGIYPYSMMMSVFTPVERAEYENTLKVTMSSQEWCGQVYAQLMLRGHHQYQLVAHSYFEREGEEDRLVSDDHLEDELWTIARLDPRLLPEGQFEILPGLLHARLRHEGINPMKANGRKDVRGDTLVYTLAYPEATRELKIEIASTFPHAILGWQEITTENGKQQITRAVRSKTIITDYWTKNKNEFLPLRDSLELSPRNF